MLWKKATLAMFARRIKVKLLLVKRHLERAFQTPSHVPPLTKCALLAPSRWWWRRRLWCWAIKSAWWRVAWSRCQTCRLRWNALLPRTAGSRLTTWSFTMGSPTPTIIATWACVAKTLLKSTELRGRIKTPTQSAAITEPLPRGNPANSMPKFVPSPSKANAARCASSGKLFH